MSIFNHAVKFRELECSIVLGGTQGMHDETKYRAAALLEILTGQRVSARPCDLIQDDPSQRAMSESQKREMDKARGEFVRQTLQKGTGGKKVAKVDSSQVSTEFRKLGSGLKLVTHLHGNGIFNFLEKMREYYLPDVIGGGVEGSIGEAHKWRPPTSGHGNNYDRKGLILHFQKWGGSTRDCYPARYPIQKDEYPKEAVTCYTLKTGDLLKFPDVELHFEALGPILGGMRADSGGGQSLQLILRPTLAIETILSKNELRRVPPVDTIKMMNYFLSQFFNTYLNRPHIGGEFKFSND